MSLAAVLLIAVIVFLLTHSLLWTILVVLLCLALGGGFTYWGPRR